MLHTWFIRLSGFWIFGQSWICFTIQKTRKYLTETKAFIKIPIVLKNLFQALEKNSELKKY